MSNESKCPFKSMHKKAAEIDLKFFPERLSLNILNQKHNNSPVADKIYDYGSEFLTLDLDEVKRDIEVVLTTSQPWWPADYGNYAPFMVRMAWHMAGTYRVFDGRGGANTANQRFVPLNSWPDNGNLDKARRLLWPVKQKYGRKLSWADLFMLTGNVAVQIMGVEPFGFGGGREDIYHAEEDTYWGPETTMLTDERHERVGEIHEPLGASEMALIYVNPEGPGGNPDPLDAAKEIRATFGNMNMNDYETVALIAGGHTFGKSHGAAPDSNLGALPENAPLEQQGLGYKNSYGKGHSEDTITSGIEGAWTANPTQWDNGYLSNLFEYEWRLIKGPGGKHQWEPVPEANAKQVPDAHVEGKTHPPMMFTTDIALKKDPTYAPIAKHFYENHDELKDAFAKAWYKLLHRDCGPVTRLLGKEVPPAQIWQDPIPALDHVNINEEEIEFLKTEILGSSAGGLVTRIAGKISTPSIEQLVRAAWASASTFRCTDYRGGANGARIRFEPQKTWLVNDPEELPVVIAHYEKIQDRFNNDKNNLENNKRVSIADLIVLGGCAAIEVAAAKAGHQNVRVPFTPGRMDAVEERTDAESFKYLEPKADAFRNWYNESRATQRAEDLMVDKAHLLSLTPPEMTVLIGGMRALNASSADSGLGVLTHHPGTLTNDFFLNLLSMDNKWEPIPGSGETNTIYNGNDVVTGKTKWRASRADLVFGSNSELRAIAEFYACDDSAGVFLQDFIKAWVKVMELDRYDLYRSASSYGAPQDSKYPYVPEA